MRDLNLYSRDLFGNVKFGFQSISNKNSNFDLLLQKIQTLILSNSKQTYFSNIDGGNVTSAGKFNFDSNGYGDFKAIFSSDLLLVKKKIQLDELTNNIPLNDKLRSLELRDVLFDQKNAALFLSIYVSTNSSNIIIKLPVK